LAMANKGTPNSNGSQFFIILDDLTDQDRLPPDFTLFGQLNFDHKPSVATLEKIEAVPVGTASDGEGSAPQQEIKILSMTVGAKFDDGCSATWSAC
ncbi:MAG: peptidylprolyl isomerase, partial [Caldilineaceae bacterium]|nr:peptidylprolyl isomerase [Caldilineaceae bacterium]